MADDNAPSNVVSNPAPPPPSADGVRNEQQISQDIANALSGKPVQFAALQANSERIGDPFIHLGFGVSALNEIRKGDIITGVPGHAELTVVDVDDTHITVNDRITIHFDTVLTFLRV